MSAPSTTAPPAPAGRGAKSTAPEQSLRSRLFRWEGLTAPYAYIAPFFLLFFAFGLFPLVYTMWISFH